MRGPKTLYTFASKHGKISGRCFKVILASLGIYIILKYTLHIKQDLVYLPSGKPQVLIPVIDELPLCIYTMEVRRLRVLVLEVFRSVNKLNPVLYAKYI